MLLPALIMLTGFIVLGVWPFGDGTILKVDCVHQYLPFFTDFHQKLRSGDSLFYSFSGGLGYDFWATYAYYLASPFNWLVVLFPKANVSDFMDFMILLKVSACGGIFSWYLHRRNLSASFLPLVFGTMYAMGNFYIGYNFNIMWLDSMAVAPLIMYGLEKLVKGRGRGGLVYGLSLFYGLWCNYYIGFMLCIFSCLYLLVCLVCSGVPGQRRSAADLVRTLLSFAWYSLLAGAMAAVILLPAYRSLVYSESMVSNTFPSELWFYTDFLSMYMSHFINAKPITISDSQVGFNAYCGTIVPLLVFCYVMERRIRLRERIAHLLLAAFLLAGVAVNYLNYMWHGFHRQNGLPNRFAFLYVLIILLLAYDVLSRISGYGIRRLLVAGTAAVALTTAALLTKELDENWAGGIFAALPIIMTVIYLSILLIIVALQPRQKIVSVLLGVLMLAEAAGHGVYGMCENGKVTRSIYLKDQASYQSLMNRQGDDTFFRSEIDSQRMRNVTMFAGGYSTVLFNSTMSEALTNFCHRIGMEGRTNKNGYNGVTRLMNDVFGIRYVLSAIGKGDFLYQFPMVDKDETLVVYRNDEALSLGFVVDENILEWNIENGTPIAVQNSFAQLAAGVEDLYILDRTVEAGDGEKVDVRVPDGKQVYLYLPEKVEKFILHTPEYNREYTSYNDHLYTMNSLGDEKIGDFTCELKSGQETAEVKIYTCPDELCRQVYEVLSESQLEDVSAFGARVTGKLDAKKDGILLITLPYDEDWTAQLDGEPVETLCIGSALTGIPVTAGTHTLDMRFRPDGFMTGALISLAALALMILSAFLSLRAKARRKRSAQERPEETRPDGWLQDEGRFAGERPEETAGAGTRSGAHVWPLNERYLERMRRRALQEAAPPKEEDADGTAGENHFPEEDALQNWKETLEKLLGAENVFAHEPMSSHTTFRIGGPADLFVTPPDEESLRTVMNWLRREEIPHYVIGNGSNLLVGDGGFRGVIVQVFRNMAWVRTEDTVLYAGAGTLLSSLSRTACTQGLSGLEFASGIPGTLGGAVVMNAGAYGGEMKDVITFVRVLTRDGEIRDIPGEQMEFGYRTSRVTREELVVLGAAVRLEKADPDRILARMQELKEQRTAKQPLDRPSAGSTFKRPEGHFAGKLIMDAGLKGFSVGGAGVSEKHAGFVVNNGNATAKDVAAVIAHVQREVERQSGIRLECEVRMIGEF